MIPYLPVKRLWPLLSVAVSAAYTGSSFLASFGTVALIVRDIDSAQRAGFFLFLAIFSPFITVLSQQNLLTIYEGKKGSTRSRISMEVVAFVLTVLTLLLFTSRFFTLAEQAILASTVFTQFHAVGIQGRIQHESGNRPIWAWAAVFIALMRIAISWSALSLGPVLAFALGSWAYLLASLALRRVAVPRPGDADQARECIPRGGWKEHIALTLFFAVGAVAYQVDKYALNQDFRADDIANSGALTMLVISPLSLMFAAIYRTRTQVLFDQNQPASEKIPIIRQLLAIYGIAALIYCFAVYCIWSILLSNVFPFLKVSYLHFAIFSLAIATDKVSSLFQFSSGDRTIYNASTFVKILSTTTLYYLINVFIPKMPLISIFFLYNIIAIFNLLLVIFLFKKKGDVWNMRV